MRARRRQNELRWSILLGTNRAEPDRPPAGKNRPLLEDLAAAAARTIDDDIENAEAMARRVLADAGLPTKLGWYVKLHDGRFEPSPMPKVKTFADAFHAEAKYLTRLAGPPLSTTRDAVLVLLAAGELRRGLAAGVEPRKLAQMAMNFGRWVEALSVSKENVWQLADSGLRHDSGRRKGGATTSAERATERDERRRVFQQVIDARPGAKVEVWAGEAAKRWTAAHPERPWRREAARRFFYDYVRKV
jgi:hypothetical protein